MINIEVKKETLNIGTGLGNHIYLLVMSNFGIYCLKSKVRSRK